MNIENPETDSHEILNFKRINHYKLERKNICSQFKKNEKINYLSFERKSSGFELGNESPKHSSTTFVLDRLNQ